MKRYHEHTERVARFQQSLEEILSESKHSKGLETDIAMLEILFHTYCEKARAEVE